LLYRIRILQVFYILFSNRSKTAKAMEVPVSQHHPNLGGLMMREDQALQQSSSKVVYARPSEESSLVQPVSIYEAGSNTAADGYHVSDGSSETHQYWPLPVDPVFPQWAVAKRHLQVSSPGKPDHAEYEAAEGQEKRSWGPLVGMQITTSPIQPHVKAGRPAASRSTLTVSKSDLPARSNLWDAVYQPVSTRTLNTGDSSDQSNLETWTHDDSWKPSVQDQN
jgi:hypothetical protein